MLKSDAHAHALSLLVVGHSSRKLTGASSESSVMFKAPRWGLVSLVALPGVVGLVALKGLLGFSSPFYPF